jgi:hypothetical protein
MARGTSGAAQGRLGGRLSGGSRAKAALKAAPRVRVVGAIAKAPAQTCVQSCLSEAQLQAAALATQGMAAALGLSPGAAAAASKVAMAAVAAATATGAGSSSDAAAGGQTGSSDVKTPAAGKRKQPPASQQSRLTMPQTKAQRGQAAPALELADVRRSTVVAVKPKASYGAGKTYYFEDVISVGKLLAAGKIEMKDLDAQDASGDLKFKVPRKSMANKWLKDDALVMAAQSKRGIEGQPHWRVEAEVRGRTELSKPGAGTVRAAARWTMGGGCGWRGESL